MRDPRDVMIDQHKQWLGYIQPVGLVVSPPALADAGFALDPDIIIRQQRYIVQSEGGTRVSLPALLTDLCGWRTTDLVPGTDPRAAHLATFLENYDETLRPTFAVPDGAAWLMLIQELPGTTPFDELGPAMGRHWHAAPQVKFERLLRETQIPIGLLANDSAVRLVYYPRGETPGHLTFPYAQLGQVAGRSMFAALHMLLDSFRLFNAPDGRRLADVLASSRKYQNTVSTELAKQVLAALYELVRGMQAADVQSKGTLLKDVLAHDPNEVYAGLLTVLMRLVFVLFAEDRGLMTTDEVYVQHYSLTGLFEKLRADAGLHPDTMDQRYGAYARLVVLCRMIHDGAKCGRFQLPPRHGYLFDPDRYPFLEGRPRGQRRDNKERLTIPLVPDGVLHRVLENLLMLDGERLSYRALDVEQIGSVYEAMMGFRVEVATGRSIAIRPKKSHGAPTTINLDALLAVKAADRAKWLKEHTDQTIDGKGLAALKDATTPEALVAALDRKVAKEVTPHIVPTGGLVLQPSDERRRSGSHYTPRSLTHPIVTKALEPVLQNLGPTPTPDALLSLKVCDPAMGSGAFLVEVCRQLAQHLVEAWHAGACVPEIPPDEDELLHAQRLIAQRCLYGVDKNPMAVDLAKLALWLATLAREHPFTFLDHALRGGDSLVGLNMEQIRKFHWLAQPDKHVDAIPGNDELLRLVREAEKHRSLIVESGDDATHGLKEQKYKLAEENLRIVRYAGDLCIRAFFEADKDKARERLRTDYGLSLSAYLQTRDFSKRPTNPLTDRQALALRPFHWDVEFPEVFTRENPGFDCIVGNPPFAGKNTIIDGHPDGYLDWLKVTHAESHGNADLVAHFFRRSFHLLRQGGTCGLIATNTIAQGDTRSSGLRWICNHGGTIYAAKRRYKWPGMAAVVVSVVHLRKGPLRGPLELDGRSVGKITAYLFHQGGNDDPKQLAANSGKSYTGAKIYGSGFTFDDSDASGTANPIAVMHELIAKSPKNQERIFPYIGGEEVNDSPTNAHHRYVINFGTMDLETARTWPDLVDVAETKVKPDRTGIQNVPWWQFERPRTEMFAAISTLKHVLVNSVVSSHIGIVFLPTNMVYSHALNIFPFENHAAFAALQARTHEVWARFFASSMKDDLRYTPSDCFETFPFPLNFETHAELEAVGKEYYEFRAALMVANDEGLTKTYNRFHDPAEHDPQIKKLRSLHDAMDRAVLQAYGPPFSTLTVPPCEFLLDYEEDEDDDPPGKRQRKKPYRYRWPDAFRDEVLALLLELNKQRADEEAKQAAATEPPKKAKKAGQRKKATDNPELFE